MYIKKNSGSDFVHTVEQEETNIYSNICVCAYSIIQHKAEKIKGRMKKGGK